MRSKALSLNEIQDNFDAALQEAIDIGAGPKSEEGFNLEVHDAITELAQRYPNATADLIQNAQQAWRRQVSGAERAEREASVMASLATRGYVTGDSLA